MTRLPDLNATPAGTKLLSTATSVAHHGHHIVELVSLPLLARGNGQWQKDSPRKRRPELDDSSIHPIDKGIQDIRSITGRIRQSFERMNQTEALFERAMAETRAWVQQLQAQQEQITRAYFEFFNYNAVQLQRVFRGYLARRAFREVLVLKATLKIQRAFRIMQAHRAERRRRFRVMLKKLLRGLKAINARHELSHNELLTRVSHNMMIERQWRMAMGVADTESNLINALYRRKFVRKQMAKLFNDVLAMNSIVRFWKSLLPARHEQIEQIESVNQVTEDSAVDSLALELNEVFITTDIDEQQPRASPNKSSLFAVTQQLSGRSKDSPRSISKRSPVTRDDLRRKQKLYTQKLYEENLKKEAARVAQLERQRESARQAEVARRQVEEEQRKLRLEQAQALKEDLERRGLLAIKELQAKKDEEIRKEEETQKRIADAKQRIANEVLSDETQTLLRRRQRPGGQQKSKP